MIPGIDVSRWQGVIDWKAVAASGIKFAMIKCGGSDAGFYKDPYFLANVKAATEAGIACGAYYYVGPNCTSYSDGAADGRRAVEICQPVKDLLSLPLAIDFEAPNGANKDGNTSAVIAFCAIVRNAGYKDMVYTSEVSGLQDRLFKDKIITDIPLWCAKWSPAPPSVPWEIWQYSDKGRVPGITGGVDLDWMSVDTFDRYCCNKKDDGLDKALQALKVAIDEVLKYVAR